jgi:hypothetical protein
LSLYSFLTFTDSGAVPLTLASAAQLLQLSIEERERERVQQIYTLQDKSYIQHIERPRHPSRAQSHAFANWHMSVPTNSRIIFGLTCGSRYQRTECKRERERDLDNVLPDAEDAAAGLPRDRYRVLGIYHPLLRCERVRSID